MKKLSLLSLKAIAVILLISSLNHSSYAQSENAGNTLVSNLTIGAKVGYTYSFLAEDYKSRFTDMRSGYMFGIAASYYILDWIAISPEVYYMEHGGNNLPPTLLYASGSPSLIDLEQIDLEIRTIEIPVLATVHIPGASGAFQLKVLAGPSFGYTLQAFGINTRELGFNESLSYTKTEFTDVIEMWEYCATVGAGFNLKIGSLVTSVEARYRAGFNNLHTRVNGEEFRSNTFMITVGVGL